MEEKDIINFRESIKNFTVEELKDKCGELREEISRMILDSDAVVKIAIIEALLKEKGEEV